MIRLTCFTPEMILPLISLGAQPVTMRSHLVRVGGKRLNIFKEKGLQCVCCKISGTFFALETQQRGITPHLNLYARVEGREVLMTVDHRFALADGGSNEMSNLDPMCAPCNVKKGSTKMQEHNRTQQRDMRGSNGRR